MNVAVYRAVSNDYDAPRDFGVPQSVQHEHYDFTAHVADPRRVSYWFKYHPQDVLPDHIDLSVWMDGNMRITNPDFLEVCIAAVKQSPTGWAAWSHPDRGCIFDEQQTLVDCNITKWPLDEIARQVESYRVEGYPDKRGLYALGCIARAHTPESREFDERAWDEMERWNGSMDQIVVPYIEWRHDSRIATFDGHETNGSLIKIGSHAR